MPKSSHIQGSKVMIYQRPITQEDEEGTATLIRCLAPAQPGELLEEWIVQFSGESASYRRSIKV